LENYGSNYVHNFLSQKMDYSVPKQNFLSQKMDKYLPKCLKFELMSKNKYAVTNL
jgi:hypothetical protein